MKLFYYVVSLLLSFAWIYSSNVKIVEASVEAILIHKDVQKKVQLLSWVHLIEEAKNIIRQKSNLKDSFLIENNLIMWNNGKRIVESNFNLNNIKNNNKNIYIFLSFYMHNDTCYISDNLYKTIGDEIEKYKSVFKNYFSFGDSKSEEWKSAEELLKLLLKSKDLRDIIKVAQTDEQIEEVRNKVIELIEKNKNFLIFVEVLKENKKLVNIMSSKEEWKKFVKNNYEHLTELIKPYFIEAEEEEHKKVGEMNTEESKRTTSRISQEKTKNYYTKEGKERSNNTGDL